MPLNTRAHAFTPDKTATYPVDVSEKLELYPKPT